MGTADSVNCSGIAKNIFYLYEQYTHFLLTFEQGIPIFQGMYEA